METKIAKHRKLDMSILSRLLELFKPDAEPTSEPIEESKPAASGEQEDLHYFCEGIGFDGRPISFHIFHKGTIEEALSKARNHKPAREITSITRIPPVNVLECLVKRGRPSFVREVLNDYNPNPYVETISTKRLFQTHLE